MITSTLDTKKLFVSLDETFTELIQVISSAENRLINVAPPDDEHFKNSWTPAQVAVHITKSNKGMAQALQMEGKVCERDPRERVIEIKKMFLDFTIKFQSPEFIIPEKNIYQKEILIAHLKKSIEHLRVTAVTCDLSEVINLPAFGEITKVEILHFVLYHTQRHIHQLKNILEALGKN